MVGFGSWLRTLALTKKFPSLSPGSRRGFFSGYGSVRRLSEPLLLIAIYASK
jgi:hypothetical protein